MAVFGSSYASLGYDNNYRTMQLEAQKLQQQMLQQQPNAAQNLYHQGLQNANAMNAYTNACSNVVAHEDFRFRGFAPTPAAAQPPEKKSMFKEIATDIKAFILEHRGVIYFIAFGLIVDHFFFKGAFKARLEQMAEKIVAKVEEKI